MNSLHRKINSNQYFQNGAAIIDPVFPETCLWPRSIYRRSKRCWSWQKFMKIWQNVYDEPNFSHVKFYHDLSADLKKLPRKPQNFGDNWPLACKYFVDFCHKHNSSSGRKYRNIYSISFRWKTKFVTFRAIIQDVLRYCGEAARFCHVKGS